MAKSTMPEGKWFKDKKTEHWLRYKKFHIFDDATGGEHIALQADLRKAMSEAASILEEHKIPIANIYSENYLDYKVYGNVYCVAIGFECKEDLVMAKLVLKADDFQ